MLTSSKVPVFFSGAGKNDRQIQLPSHTERDTTLCRRIVFCQDDCIDTDRLVSSALRAGAVGFLLKDSSPEQILEAVRTAADGERPFSAAVLEQLVTTTAMKAPSRRTPGTLTAREREVAVLVAQGLVNVEIADRLGIGAATVKTHVSALLEKFQVRNRVQLAVAVAECQLTIA